MEEVSVGKITKKFIIKFIIFFLIIDIVVGGIVFMSSLSGVANENDEIEIVKGFNGSVKLLIVVNILAAVVPGLLATRSIKKKYVINDSNKMSVFRNIAIFLAIMTALMIAIHGGIKGTIENAIFEDSGLTKSEYNEMLDDLDKLSKKLGVARDEMDTIKGFFGVLGFYAWDGIAFTLMIAGEYYLIVKRSEQAA